MTNHITCCMSIIISKRMGMGWLKSYPNNCTWIIVSCILTSCEKWQNILSCFILLKNFWISAFSCCSELQCRACFFFLNLNKAKHWPSWVAVPGSLHSEKQKLTTRKWKGSMLWQEVKTAHNTRTLCDTFICTHVEFVQIWLFQFKMTTIDSLLGIFYKTWHMELKSHVHAWIHEQQKALVHDTYCTR
jgi:hypothetical protein